MRSSAFSSVLLGLLVLPLSTLPHAFRADLPMAGYEDYRRSAGIRRGDTVEVTLDAQAVRWRPYGTKGGTITAYTFVERGRAPLVPGPMLRVTSGTVIRATLRNTLDTAIVVFGLQDHPASLAPDSVALAPAAEQVVTFKVTAPGTYYYWGRLRLPGAKPTPFDAIAGGGRAQGPFIGALIVDRAGEAPPRGERILMLTRWFDTKYPAIDTAGTWKIMVNGASWPSTERLEYTVGDTVRWRVLNPMLIWHPMHLHGFYFNVTARGDNRLDTLYTTPQRRTVVTELMSEFSTMQLEWVPERAGNWLFHCHLVRHMAMPQFIQDTSASAVAATQASAYAHAEDHMAGLVIGVIVRPGVGQAGNAMMARATGKEPAAPKERSMRLVATTKANVYAGFPAYSFIQQQGSREPASDSIRMPGSTLTLVRGQPARITVVNRTGAPLAVHWHGMEIESWYDGVGGWSGAGTSVRPPIAEGDSFIVRMTPKRAGTFIYHTHDETGNQLAAGLYGALLVVEPGTVRDTTRDHVMTLGLRGHSSTSTLAINGATKPSALPLRAGEPARLRFVSIPVNERIAVELLGADGTLQHWLPVAADGAELPSQQRLERVAALTLSAGQTYDVQVRLDSAALASGQYFLRFRTEYYTGSARAPDTTVMPLTIRK